MNAPLRPRQLVLALDHSESYAREDFLAGPSNSAALALIDSWPDWPNRIMALNGPDSVTVAILADALQDAGCVDDALLETLRNGERFARMQEQWKRKMPM